VYNTIKRVKKRIDTLLLKTLEFKNAFGQKIKIMEIPVLEEDSPYHFLIQVRLQTFMTNVYGSKSPKNCYSFRDYLKRVLKWPDYERLFEIGELKNNA
jgi:uncharacterized protein Veg